MEEKLFDGAFFSKLNTMKLLMKMRLNDGMGGQHKSSAKGHSVEFSDFREYIPGDDIRRIDWNVYGRMDKLFIKQFMEEKEGLFHIIVDCSKSMDFGEKNKSIQARRIAGMFSYLVLNDLDRVYLTALHAEKAVTTKGMTGRQAFPDILDELERMEFVGETSLLKAVKTMPFQHRGVVILISDFLQEPETETGRVADEKSGKGSHLEELVKYLRFCKQEVLFVQVLSKEEEEPLGEGTLELIDMETKGHMKVTMTTRLSKEYESSLKELKTNIERVCKKYQVSFLSVSTEEALEAVMFKGIRAGKLMIY